MYEHMLGNYVQERGIASGYEVRLINSLTAYEWLSNDTTQKITHAMQNRKLEVFVDDLLRLGVLMEHGGLLLKVSETLLISDLQWLDDYFNEENNTTEVLLFTEGARSQLQYQEYFFAALPQSSLFTDVFKYMCQVYSTGEMLFPKLSKNFYIF